MKRKDLVKALKTSRPAYGYVVWHEDDGRHIQLVKSNLIRELTIAFDPDEEVRAVVSDDGIWIN